MTTTGLAQGLSIDDAARRLERDGPNTLPSPPSPSQLLLLGKQFTHFFALMLWGAAGLAVIAGMPQLGIAIVVVIIVNAVFAFVQEFRADRAAASLTALLPTRAVVVRSGRRMDVSADDLVVDDVVLLEGGARVCADLEILTCAGLAVDESMLTGESAAVWPGAGDRLYAGTFAVEGEAATRVVDTGSRTRLAGIAAMTEKVSRPKSPLAQRLSRVVAQIAVIAVTVGVSCFAIALALGTPATQGFLFAIGVTVALVPEGLLPTVTLSLARAAQRMAQQNALVRRLESVETLGSTTYICSDKTGTITQNQMSVVEVWTPSGRVTVYGTGYEAAGTAHGSDSALAAARELALSAVHCSTGRTRRDPEGWTPVGDPMEVALHVLSLRLGLDGVAFERTGDLTRRIPFDPRRRRASAIVGDGLHVKGASDDVLPLCEPSPEASAAVHRLAERGLRVLAVARRDVSGIEPEAPVDTLEQGLTLLGLVGIEDPPRPGVTEALLDCRAAGIRAAMITGDHPRTAQAIAVEVGLTPPGRDDLVLEGRDLPLDETELGALLDRDGVVVARVTPEQKLRIAHALQSIGHVVAMTGDGVNDGPALREADIGIAMGHSGTDVAREAADLILLDDHFATIISAVAFGRATFLNIRRFLTYHLTDNVAELTPFVVWALSGGNIPLALTVIQVLALDIGTDLLPALALGAEPPGKGILKRPPLSGQLIDRRMLSRVFGVLGPAEAVVEMLAFIAVLLVGGWVYGQTADDSLLAIASGAAFSAVVLGQLANAFAVRSSSQPAWRLDPRGNTLLLGAVAVEALLLVAFLTLPPLPELLGGAWPSTLGWALAFTAIPAVLIADAVHKRWIHHR